MIERICLTEEQLERLHATGDVLPLTWEQYELIKTQGIRRCAVIGDEFVRMDAPDLEAVLKTAFKAACHAGVSQLGLMREDELKGYDMQDYQFGDQVLRVTTTATDGRSVTCSGPIVLPSEMVH
jgi:hypothetical protein